jgi:hypothetical protein
MNDDTQDLVSPAVFFVHGDNRDFVPDFARTTFAILSRLGTNQQLRRECGTLVLAHEDHLYRGKADGF